jgi:thioredoxin 1
VLDAVAKEYAGHVELSYVDVDEDKVTTAEYDVRSMPTLVFVRDGREVGRIIGSRPRAFVAGVLDRILNGDVAVASP